MCLRGKKKGKSKVLSRRFCSSDSETEHGTLSIESRYIVNFYIHNCVKKT